jgi:hypothetical protein
MLLKKMRGIMNIKLIATFLMVSSFSLLTHARGLYLYNNTGDTLQYSGTNSGVIQRGNHMNFPNTPTLLSIKRAGGIWIPLETYLINMSFKKQGKPEQNYGGILSGILIINSNNIESAAGYVDKMGNIKQKIQ